MPSLTEFDSMMLCAFARLVNKKVSRGYSVSEILGRDDLCKNLSPLAKKLAGNIDDISNGRKLSHPELGLETMGVLQWANEGTKEFRTIVNKYCPEYWDLIKKEEIKKRRREQAEKRREAKEIRKWEKERNKNPLLAEALDEIRRLRESLASVGSGGGCQCGNRNDWPSDDGRISGRSPRSDSNSGGRGDTY